MYATEYLAYALADHLGVGMLDEVLVAEIWNKPSDTSGNGIQQRARYDEFAV